MLPHVVLRSFKYELHIRFVSSCCRILYPPGCVPPGVHPSPDGADVATPVSLIEWFINFYDSTREGRVRPVECVCGPGELVFVPR